MKNTLNLSLLALAVASALSACGGGGGAGTSADAGNTTVTTTTSTTVAGGPTDSTAGNIITGSQTSATYGAGTESLAAYNYLNAQRGTCAFGLVQQDNRIDIAAQGHANYLLTNNLTGHYEDQVAYPTGFIGATLYDRFQYASYPYSDTYLLGGNEVVAGSGPSFGVDRGTANVMTLFTGPYHGLAMLKGYRDVGIGIQTNATPRTVFVMDFGSTATRPAQLLSSTTVATYPCQGVSGVLSKTYADEMPAPITGRNLQTTPIGHPIYIKVRDGQTLNLTAADLRVDGSATPLTLRKLDKASDPNHYLDDSTVIYMPDAALATNTTYRFTGTGTNNGQAVNINFTFTTGAF